MAIKKLLGLLLMLPLVATAQQKHELTVKEAVDLAFKNVTEIKNAQIDYKIQEAKNREILGQAYPQITGNMQANHYLKLPAVLFPDGTSTAVYSILKEEGVTGSGGPITKVPDPVVREVSFQQPWNMSLGVTIQQLLFQPDVFVGLQARQTALDYNAALIEQSKEKIKDSAYKRYYAILIAEKQLYYMDEGIERLEKLYRDDSIMFKNGFAERLDLDKVTVQLNNLRTSRNTVASFVKVAYAALKFAIGVPQTDTVVLKETLTPESVKNNILDNSFAYENRPEIRTLGFVRKLGELDVKRNQLGNIPTVSAIGNYSMNAQGPKFFTHKSTSWIESAFIGINVNVPIFDGGQRRYKVRQAQFQLEKLDNTIENLKQGIDFEQVVTRESLTTSLTNLDISEKNMELAERVFNTTKLKFQEGLGSSFEVLQADADMQLAQSNYFTALYNAIIAKISYQRSLGKLE